MGIVCPCIPFHRRHFDAMKRCWCGLFVHKDVTDPDSLPQVSAKELSLLVARRLGCVVLNRHDPGMSPILGTRPTRDRRCARIAEPPTDLVRGRLEVAMKRALPIVVALPFVLAAVSLLAQSQRLHVIPIHAFTAEPRDATLQLPDLAERRETLKDLRGCLFGPLNASVRADEAATGARAAVEVEVVSRNVNADDPRLHDVRLQVTAAGKSFTVEGSGDKWEDAARDAANKIRRWIAENASAIDGPPRLSGPIR
jgi:hypothetical protein